MQGNAENNSKILLNRFYFFDGLEQNMLLPSQIQILLQLSEDNLFIYRAGSNMGRVVVTKLVLWILRMSPDGLVYVMENCMIPQKRIGSSIRRFDPNTSRVPYFGRCHQSETRICFLATSGKIKQPGGKSTPLGYF